MRISPAADSLAVSTSAGRRFACFDGLRAIAALAVLVHHAGFDSGVTYRWRIVGDLLARGDIGVPIFFAISGFLLYRPYAAANAERTALPSAGGFYRRRFLRIFPAYWLALAVLVTFFGVSLGSGSDPVLYVTLAQIYRSRTALGGLPQAWSLCVEVTFYLLLPVYAAAMRRVVGRSGRWLPSEAAGLVGLVVVSFLYRGALEVADPSWKGTALFWLPAHLELFAVGMMYAVWSVAEPRHGLAARLGRTVGEHPGLAWLAAGAAFATVSLALDLPKGVAPFSGRQLFERQGLYALVALLLLAPAVFDLDFGYIRRFLRWRPVAFVGLVSYGVYLWHKTLVLHAVDWLGGDHRVLRGNFPLTVVVALGLSLMFATASRYWLEEPLHRRWANRGRSRP
ncbi:MAG: acyltransferase 3 [Acidimicrobiia bacterium]|nr:acyltransferase 3 [Acidimicrobiia bacterium]